MTLRHMLFPYDFSSRAQQIVPFVRALAVQTGAHLTLLSVMPPTFDAVPAEMGPELRTGDDAAGWVHNLQAKLDLALPDDFPGVRVERLALGGDPAVRIVGLAGERGVDLIAMPTHGLGVFRTMLLGSVTSKVLHDAKCPVWTAAHAETQEARHVPRSVLCAVDGSDATPALLRWAVDFARTFDAALNVLHVVGPVTDWPSLPSEQRFQEQVRKEAHQEMASMMKSAAVDAPLRVPVGPIVQTVVDEARQQGADVVIVGRGSVPEPFGRLRTHAFGIIQRAPCPVISV